MSCTKRAFASPKAAQRQLRTWQQKGRRAELDTVHVYKADCREHLGKFHIGHTHDTQPKRGRPLGSNAHNRVQMFERILDEVDDIFDKQLQRIAGRISREDRRRRKRFATSDEGPLITAESGTLCPAGDEINVDTK